MKLNHVNKALKVFDFDPYQMRGDNFYRGIVEYRNAILPQNVKRILPRSEFKCALCGHSEGDSIIEWEQGYLVIQCSACSYSTANFAYGEFTTHINISYNNELYYDKFQREIVANYEYRKQQMGEERFTYILDRLNIADSDPHLLDVGCGAGWFLSYLKDAGIRSRGLEVNPMAVRFCTERGLNVAPQNLSDEPDLEYDVITMFDVLEHLTEPIETMQHVANKLKPGGFFVGYTPNIHSIAYELMGAKSNTLLPFEHTGFYDESSFSYLADNIGMTVHSIDVFGFDIMDYLLMKEFEDGHPYAERLREMMLLTQSTIDAAGVGNHYRVTLVKPE